MQTDLECDEFDLVVDNFLRAATSCSISAGFHLNAALASGRRLAGQGHTLRPDQYDAIVGTLPKIQAEIGEFVPLGLAATCFEMLERSLRSWTEPPKVRSLLCREDSGRADTALTLLWATARALDAAEALGAGPRQANRL